MKNILLAIIVLISFSCTKFLDEKSDKKLVVPATLADLQALLDNTNHMVNVDPYVSELSTDDIYVTTTTWNTLTDYDRNAYTWQKENVYESTTNDWLSIYRKIYVANTVLETLQKIEQVPSNAVEWDNIKGQALMHRGKALFLGVLVWSKAWDESTADTDMGIPIRLNTDMAEPSVRPSVRQTYTRAINDLQSSLPCLPAKGIHPIRSCRAAAYGFLARAYMAMRNYPLAGLYADSSLQINSSLLNYNSVSTTPTFTIPLANPELNFFSLFATMALHPSFGRVDSLLYASYAANDCRKTVFFLTNPDGSHRFRGSYTASGAGLSGIATDEMYLTRAEAFARAGNTTAALADLNKLLQARMKTGTFIAVIATGPSDALNKVLIERRKQLLVRGIRWMDIKRLNKEGAGISLTRKINNITYTMAPNANGFALPIPEYVINISGMPQNPL